MAEKICKTERQLNLVSTLLKSTHGLRWTDIARIEGYDDAAALRSRQKRLERDLKDLEATGLSVRREGAPGIGFSYVIDRERCLLPALQLTAAQKVLLYRVGLGYLEGAETGPLQKHLAGALVKLQAGVGLPDRLPRAFVTRTLHRKPSEKSVLDALGLHLLERRRSSFRYRDRDGNELLRKVQPWALLSRRSGWYLIAHDEDRQDVRVFRLSRIRGEVKPTRPDGDGSEYEIPAGFDPEVVFSTSPFGSGRGSYRDVRIRFDAETAFIARNDFEGLHRLEDLPDGSLVLHLEEAWPQELLRYLGEFPGHWEVLEPTTLREWVIWRLQEALEAAEA